MCGAATPAAVAAVQCAIHGPNKPVVTNKQPLVQPSSCHVLLVDDERLTRTVVANLLHKCGYKVTSASDGLEALQLLRSSAPDTFQLVLTDVCMPELNGIQLLSCVKQDANLRAVPVVMMSSVDQEATVAECVQQGAEEYLVKPVTRKEVQHIWQHVWRKRCAATATVPQLPLEAAAAVAAAAAAAATQEQQQAAGAAALPPAAAEAELAGVLQAVQACAAAAAQDVHQPAAASSQQQAAQPADLPGIPLSTLITGTPQEAASSLQQRQRVFTTAVSLLHAAHLQQRPLLSLRPSRLAYSPQHGLTAAAAPLVAGQGQGQVAAEAEAAEVDSLYVSPEESAGLPGCQSDMFSLGLLFVDLFFPCTTHEQRCAQLRAARAAVLPPVLSGAHTAGSMRAVQDLLRELLQADPARRPSVHAVLRAGILEDAYRLIQQLPYWRLLSTAAAQQAALGVSAAPASAAAATATASALPQSQPAGAATASLQAPAAAAAAATAAATPVAALVAVDHDAVRHFLLLLRKSKQQEMAQAAAQVAALDSDIGDVRRRQRAAALEQQQQAAAAGKEEEQAEEAEEQEGAAGPASKRARVMEDSGDSGEVAAAAASASGAAAPLVGEQQQRRMAAVMPALEDVFFQRRQRQQQQQQQGAGREGREGYLESFARDLNALASHSKLELKATLRSGDLASPVEMACCAAFDRDDEFFATVGVSRRVKIFDFQACLGDEERGGGPGVMHYPALQITTRSKLSSVSWNSYIKSQLITSDYSGLIQLWDAATAAEVAQYDEHARRVWSVDFSTTDPMRFLSGSDDGSVRLWSVHEQSSVSRIAAPANVCSVQFSPTDSHTIAFGCANYRVYLYDLRHTAHPLAVVCGPQRAVSYVKFLGGSHLVSASTDSTLRLWDLRDLLTSTSTSTTSGTTSGGGHGAAGGRCRPACTYTGHRNQRNFVGLSVSSDGHILCGSEDNSVYAYHRSLPFSTARYCFSPSSDGSESHQPFVSAVCWANRSRHCLAANSQGLLQVLKLE